MKLLFVTDNGFTCKDGVFYYDTPNATHIAHLSKFFDEFVVVARNNPFEKKYIPVNANVKVNLVYKWNVLKLSLLTRKLAKECDAVICYCQNGYFAAKAGKAAKIPVIAYVGGDPFEALMCRKTLTGNILAYIARYMWRTTNKLSDYSHYCHEFFFKKFPTEGKTLFCSGVNIVTDKNTLENRLKKIDQSREKLILGLIGHTKNNIKGIDRAIKAIGSLGDRYYLEVIGRGDTKEYLELAEECGCIERVKFLGVKQPAEVLEWLDTIDIYVQPSRSEGLPRATIEAMSRACPVVCSNTGALPAIINNHFVFKQEDEDKMASLVLKISEIETMKKEAIANFEHSKEFEASVRERKYNEFYSMIVEDIKNNQHK